MNGHDLTRTALITGSARGIGRGIALRLAADGLDVAVADLPAMRPEADAVVDEIRAAGRQYVAIDVDVSDAGQVDAMVRTAVTELGRLDVMVANAGIADVAPLIDVTPEAFDRLISINLRGVFLCYTAAARQMIKQGGGGKIIDAASIAAHKGFAMLGHYSASKWAVRGLTQAAAQEWAEHGITVNAYCPAIVGTPCGSSSTRSSPKLRASPRVPPWRSSPSSSRSGEWKPRRTWPPSCRTPASPDADYMTGESVMTDGGVLFA
jgi:meso-butanediol dehydrogenase / (S,S)-butanediol dehydrogenase / diacetyl reductase